MERNLELLSRLAHEANRALCEAFGERQPPWERAPETSKAATRRGVRAVLRGDAKTPAELHRLWVDAKVAEGWKYGKEKDAVRKTHPKLVPFEKLSLFDRAKDHLFLGVVLAALHERVDP